MTTPTVVHFNTCRLCRWMRAAPRQRGLIFKLKLDRREDDTVKIDMSVFTASWAIYISFFHTSSDKSLFEAITP